MGKTFQMKSRYLIYIAALVLALAAYFGASPSGPRKGELAPDFQLSSSDGKEYTLKKLISKKPLVLAFWAEWCSKCRKELPNLKALAEAGEYNVVIVSSGASNVNGLLVLLDNQLNVTALYGVEGIPQTFFISQDGIIEKRIIGSL